jgi:hypothetical protein
MEDLGTLQAMGLMNSSKQAVTNLTNHCLLPSACPLPTSNFLLAPACRCPPALPFVPQPQPTLIHHALNKLYDPNERREK